MVNEPPPSTRVVHMSDLTAADVDAMYSLFEAYYQGTCRERFERDLERKEQVIVLTEPHSGAIVGFSTVRLLEPSELGERCRVIYSGDTVVAEPYWGSKALQRGFTQVLFRQRFRDPLTPLYWLLTTKGYRTYLLMTNYFPESYPRWERPTPRKVEALRRRIGRLRYGEDFDPERGVVVYKDPRDRLQSGVCHISQRDLRNAHIRHFVELNPNHAEGEELVCLARIRRRDPLRIAAKLLRHRLDPRGFGRRE